MPVGYEWVYGFISDKMLENSINLSEGDVSMTKHS